MQEPTPQPLDEHDRSRYAWQIDVPDFGEEGQARLKGASVLVTRCGGLGSPVAYELAAAGVGRIILAHGGDLKTSDLNRQLLMKDSALGSSRVAGVLRLTRDRGRRPALASESGPRKKWNGWRIEDLQQRR